MRRVLWPAAGFALVAVLGAAGAWLGAWLVQIPSSPEASAAGAVVGALLGARVALYLVDLRRGSDLE